MGKAGLCSCTAVLAFGGDGGKPPGHGKGKDRAVCRPHSVQTHSSENLETQGWGNPGSSLYQVPESPLSPKVTFLRRKHHDEAVLLRGCPPRPPLEVEVHSPGAQGPHGALVGSPRSPQHDPHVYPTSVGVFSSINSLFQDSLKLPEVEKKEKQTEILRSLRPDAPHVNLFCLRVRCVSP